MAAEPQSHLRRAGMSMPVSWLLASSPGSGEAARSCGRRASLPTCLLGCSSEGPRMQVSGLEFCSLGSAPICCPSSLALGQFASVAALKPSPSHFLLSASPVPRETMLEGWLLLDLSTWSLCVLILSGLAHAQFLSVLTLAEHHVSPPPRLLFHSIMT